MVATTNLAESRQAMRWNEFLDKPVFLEISLIEIPSRIFMRLTLPIMSMVITSFAPAKKFSSRVIHPGQF